MGGARPMLGGSICSCPLEDPIGFFRAGDSVIEVLSNVLDDTRHRRVLFGERHA